MTDTSRHPGREPEPTSVDDVRRVREKIARAHEGHVDEHVLESNRIAENLRQKLNVRLVAAPPTGPRSGTGA